MWLCPGQGHTGGLGKWGTQGLNGCGVKQVFRMDTARPEVVIHLLLLLSDGYWAPVAALSEINLGNLVVLSEGLVQWVLWARQENSLQGESLVPRTLPIQSQTPVHGVD